MGITPARSAAFVVVLAIFALPSTTYGNNVWETILEKMLAREEVEISDLFDDDDQDLPDTSETENVNSHVTLDTGGRHLIRYDKADVDQFNPFTDLFIDAQYDADEDTSSGLDYIIWAGQFGDAENALDDPDANGDGAVDGLDYLIWAGNFGSDSSPRTFAPEPATFGLMVLGALPVLIRWRRR